MPFDLTIAVFCSNEEGKTGRKIILRIVLFFPDEADGDEDDEDEEDESEKKGRKKVSFQIKRFRGEGTINISVSDFPVEEVKGCQVSEGFQRIRQV